MQKNSILLALPVLALAALSACGGGGNAKNTSTTTTTTVTSPGPAAAGGAMSGAMANGAPAPVPASLHCGAVAPVWVNLSRHVYHTSTDPYYGRTKHGEYMCASAAVAAGYHAAGSRGSGTMNGRHHRKGSMGGAMNSATAMPEPSPT